jgi:dihydroxy-acid dehydratase
MIGHAAPEAFVGGPIAALEDGDVVTVDIPERELSVELSDEEIRRRLEEREEPEPAYPGGVLAKYGEAFGSAAEGAVTNPAARRD